MLAKVKFCGMTRPQDAALAAEIGANYVGVIFANGPRKVTVDQAREILDAAGPSVRHVGVFGTNDPDEIVGVAEELGLHVVQLHADPGSSAVEALRDRFVVTLGARPLPKPARISAWAIYDVFDTADGVLLDAHSKERLGGTGVPLPWNALAVDLARDRGSAEVILAGGLNPGNVSAAIRILAPDVVDVSSGVESAPGIKDPWLMREFFDAAVGHPAA